MRGSSLVKPAHDESGGVNDALGRTLDQLMADMARRTDLAGQPTTVRISSDRTI